MAKPSSILNIFSVFPDAAKGAFAILFMVNSLVGCEGIWSSTEQETDPHLAKRELKVAGLVHPLSISAQSSSGFEHDLIEKFAAEKNYRVTWQLFKSAEDATSSLEHNNSDLAAARLNLNLASANQETFMAGPSYEEAPLSLICPRVNLGAKDEESSLFQKLFGERTKIPESVKTVIAQGTDLVGEWQGRFNAYYPGLKLLSVAKLQAKDLLKTVGKERIACALVEKNEAQFYLRFFPTLQIVRDLSPPMSLGFLINKNKPDLQRELFSWFQKASRNHQIEHLRDLYFSHFSALSEMDEVRFYRDTEGLMKELAPHFKKVAKEFALPWTLLAAVAYQESHWDNEAESFTGVKGIMMLTRKTAEHVGIEDREDMEQSLWGGAKYLRWLIDSQPKNLPRRQRLVLALATYNVGPAHMIDAQKLAEQFGFNPNSWSDLKKVLPLLSKPEYYDNLDYGEARGQEPIDFANRVMSYYELLSTKI